MPRASWKGFLRLSLVSCPVYLSPATTRTKSIRLNQVWVPRTRLAEPVETEEDEEPAPVKTYRLLPETDTIKVVQEADGLRVIGRRAERTVAMADLESDEGLADLQRRLDRMGVFKALEEAGVAVGDRTTVAISSKPAGGRRVMTRLPGAEAPNGETRLAYPRLRPGGKRIHAGVSPRRGKRTVMAFLPKFG